MPVVDRPSFALAVVIAVGLLGASACGAGPGDAPAAGSDETGAGDARAMAIGEPVAVGSDLEVTRLAPGVWLHTSWYTYPGGARVPSNGLLVRGILFGGCAVRAASATSPGNVAHADTLEWPRSVARALERYGSARLVVPGHGDIGGPELLEHTRTLFER